MRLREWFLKIFFWRKSRKRAKMAPVDIANERTRAVKRVVEQNQNVFDKLAKSDKPLARKPLGEIRAVRKMQHGHQAPWYRQSVKKHLRPEEPED